MRIAIRGFGSVGQGLAEVLRDEGDRIRREESVDVRIVAAEDSSGSAADPDGIEPAELLEAKSEGPLASGRWTASIEDVDYDVLVEATPTDVEGGEPGMSNIREALSSGTHVVTSNKAPLALSYRELTELARENGVELLFEATVGGGMPLINLSRRCLAGNEVTSIHGVLNGTCNYILSRMAVEGLSYEQVLSDAQELGVAEADPTYDVEGLDTALKLVILADAVMGLSCSYDDVEVEGITGITQEALRLAGEDNMKIKLVGTVHDSRIEVGPRLVPSDHPLDVPGVLNAATLSTGLAGDITVTGMGAGSIETASAILSDLLSIPRA
ncbi:MAG: hypothetical protein MAG715_01163 [Methanonatronarchaeales archaeon]|nr:hypothetical protein [Methanonatronarchaeales archaeon]